MTNPIIEYDRKLQSGEIVGCRKIKTVYQYLASEVTNPSGEWFYDETRADHVITFFEKYLRHSKGKWGGRMVKLELWQKAFLAALFGFIDIDGNRKYQRGILIIGKKNGKSFMASGLGLYGLMSDGEPGAEVVSVATKKDQAKIIWDEAKRMRNKAPALRKRTRATVGGIFYDDADSSFKPLASDVNSLDGLNIHFALMDEFQQWQNGRPLYDIIADGVSAREQPMILMTSTAGTVRGDIYDEIYEECSLIVDGYLDKNGYKDERTLPIVYELDSKDEWTNPDAWIKANPNLGVSKKFDYLVDKVERAKKNPKLVKNLVCKEFNIRETSESTLFTWEELNNEAKFDIDKLKPDYGVGGFDLSVRGDLTAAVVTFMLPGDETLYVESMFWMPEDVLDEHIKSDKVPYDIWRDQGFLRICPGNQIDYKMVRDWFVEMRDKYDIYLPWIGYDPAYSAYLVDDMKDAFGQNSLIPVRQGFMTLGMPMATLEKMVKSHRVNYNNNPIMKYNLTCLTVEEDRNGNLMPSKRQRSIQRIDGFSALLDAWVVMSDKMDQYQGLI